MKKDIWEDNIKCESIFNDDRTHRFLWRRIWDKDKPIITVIMLNPCLSDNIITDTTHLIIFRIKNIHIIVTIFHNCIRS